MEIHQIILLFTTLFDTKPCLISLSKILLTGSFPNPLQTTRRFDSQFSLAIFASSRFAYYLSIESIYFCFLNTYWIFHCFCIDFASKRPMTRFSIDDPAFFELMSDEPPSGPASPARRRPRHAHRVARFTPLSAFFSPEPFMPRVSSRVMRPPLNRGYYDPEPQTIEPAQPHDSLTFVPPDWCSRPSGIVAHSPASSGTPGMYDIVSRGNMPAIVACADSVRVLHHKIFEAVTFPVCIEL